MFRVVQFSVAVGFLLVCIERFAADGQETSKRQVEVINRVRRPVGPHKNLTALQLRSDRRGTIQYLLELAKAQRTHIRIGKLSAIELLGDYRAVESREFLVEQIEYSPHTIVVKEPHPLNRYPAAKALVKIGNPAIPQMIVRLNKPVTDKELRIFSFVIAYIEARGGESVTDGLGKEMGLYRLQQILKRTDPRAERTRKNLTRLIEMYQSIDFTNPHHWPRPDR